VQSKIAYASEDCSWFLSPRHAGPAITAPEQQHFSSSRGPMDRIRASTPGWKDSHARNSTKAREQYYHILPQLLRNASCPLPGRVLAIRIHGRDFFRYHVQRGKAAHLDDYCFQMLFQCLSLKNVIYIVNCLLLEQRVLVHSSVRVLASGHFQVDLCCVTELCWVCVDCSTWASSRRFARRFVPCCFRSAGDTFSSRSCPSS
jgi:hypothetical protein